MLKTKWQNFTLFFHDASSKGILLLLACLSAIIMVNFAPSKEIYDGFVHGNIYIWAIPFNIFHTTNEFLMAIFFLLIGLEIKREMVDGNLTTSKQRSLPVIAAIGGVIVPIIIYIGFNYYDNIQIRGWAIPAATDIAFSLAVLSVFGKKLPVPLRLFLTALAIIDDFIAIIILSLFYSNDISGYYLSMILVFVMLLTCLNLVKIGKIWMYLLMGFALWYAFLNSGIHASLSGFVLGMCIPYDSHSSRRYIMQVLEEKFSYCVQYLILPLFVFVNSGAVFNLDTSFFADTVVIGVVAGLFFGKQLGVFGTSYLMIKNKLAVMPAGASWKQLYGTSILCGIGFTMSLFVGNLAFAGSEVYLNKAKLGILMGSLCSAIFGAIYLSLIPKGKAKK